MKDKFKQVCKSVFNFKDHKDPLIRRIVIELMPALAKYDPETFSKEYLSTCMDHLLVQLKKERERNAGKYHSLDV
jgi:FKBP12-rapamycin complex-associated protein